MCICDIYAQPSSDEGKSVAIDEAKILCKPILVTNFSTVYDQIEDNVTGVIIEMNPIKISEALNKLICNEDKIINLSNNLYLDEQGNENEIDKLYEIINI